MDTESPRVGKDARAGKSTPADVHGSSGIPPEKQSRQLRAEAFKIVIAPGIWRGVDVMIEPPTVTHPLRSFRDIEAALDFAEELARITSWPVLDRTGGGQ